MVGYAAGALLLSTLILMKVVGPRPPGFGARLVLVSAMLGVSLVTGFWVDPQIASMRASVGVPISTLAPDDARRVRFGRLHGLSTALMAVTALGGAGALLLGNARIGPRHDEPHDHIDTR